AHLLVPAQLQLPRPGWEGSGRVRVQPVPRLLSSSLGNPGLISRTLAVHLREPGCGRWYNRTKDEVSRMKKLVPFLLSASLGFAGGIPSQNIYGNYIEARTADVYTGPCFANSEAGLIGELAVFGWKVEKGSWQGVDLDGLSVVAAVRASATLG